LAVASREVESGCRASTFALGLAFFFVGVGNLFGSPPSEEIGARVGAGVTPAVGEGLGEGEGVREAVAAVDCSPAVGGAIVGFAFGGFFFFGSDLRDRYANQFSGRPHRDFSRIARSNGTER
jgi:hypothetical protein